MPMVFEKIENIKRQYTDKYVIVDGQRPELARFADQVGQVKTVNMSGRALVEFHDFHSNIGWYDIDIDYLKVVDKPAEETKSPAKKLAANADAKAPAAKPAAAKGAPDGGKKLSPLEMARMQGAAKQGGAVAKKEPTEAKKSSVAEKLEAARAQKPAAAGANQPMSVAEKLEAARSKKKPPAGEPEAKPAVVKPVGSGKADRSKMSVAEMLAAARAEKSGGAAPAAEATPEPADASDTPDEEPPAFEADDETETEVESAEAPAAEGPSSGGRVDKSSMSVAEIIAWCREHDAS